MFNQDQFSDSARNAETAVSTIQSHAMYQSKYGEFPKLNHLNYSQWRKHMEVILRAEDAFELTIGNEQPPPDNQRIQQAEYRRQEGKEIAPDLRILYYECPTVP